MEAPDTDSIRKQAPNWTLASDEQLLVKLQSTHQRLLAKCQVLNSQLEQLTAGLNGASISLQNVNNQFMALSSSQFIESRVYDDDDLSTDVPAVKEPPKPVIPDEMTLLKRSLSVLENTHEVITILHDSDTESDTDDEMTARMVLKPKDVYWERPLPHIIGSQAWRNKWHAGLVVEDSGSETSCSRGDRTSDRYSSDEELQHQLPQQLQQRDAGIHVPDSHTTMSETSSEFPSEQAPLCKPTPADVASELARRLGGKEPPKVDREPQYEEPTPAVRKVYRPQDPISSTIFPESPPPLSDGSDSPQSDMFAELHRSQPYAQAHAAGELFGFTGDARHHGDIFSGFATKPVTDPSAKQSVFESGPTPHMFDKLPDTEGRPTIVHNKPVIPEQPKVKTEERSTYAETEKGVKKPVGGISLFGNKDTESIGAAILKRNQRKSFASGDESDSDSRSETRTNQQIRKEKDIFDDLFARSEGKKATKEKVDIAKDIKAAIVSKKEERVKDKKPVEKPKVDLFSDNLFDDIDDIFSTDVVKMPSKDEPKAKSLFEDDDDLFSEITAPKSAKIEVASSSNNKNGIFDSDDELFSENIPKPKAVKPKISEKAHVNVTEGVNKVIEPSRIIKEVTKSIFDDDEDDIFSDVKINKVNEGTEVQNSRSNDILNSVSQNEAQTSNIEAPKSSSNNLKNPSLFDDDDESDLFAESTKSLDISKVAADSEKSRDASVVSPSSSLNQESLLKSNNLIVNKEIKNIANNVNKTNEIRKMKDEDLPISENVDRNKSNTIQNTESKGAKLFEHISKSIQRAESSIDSNDDISDQDFDDPPQEIAGTNRIVVNSTIDTAEESETLTKTIFNDNTLQDDIFSKSTDSKQNTDKSEIIFENHEVDFTLPKETENDKTNVITTKNVDADIFSNILSEPPEFEKPKEPKKSKNVNALFDDDSDDESLFFKKNDPTFEDNPSEFAAKQDRFGIFTDEPPDSDSNKIDDDLDDVMFYTLPTPKVPQDDNSVTIPNTDNNADITPVPQNDNNIPSFDNIDPVEELFSTIPENEIQPKTPSIPDRSREPSVDQFNQSDSVILKTVEQPLSIASDDDLFKTPTEESKPNLPKRLLDVSDDGNLFSSVPKLEKPVSSPMSKMEDDELFQSLPIQKPLLPSESKITEQDPDSKDDELFKIPKSKPQYVPKSENAVEPEAKSEPKKIGKLNVGFNINVNALLPGASPKKAKPNDQLDGQAQSIDQTSKPEPKLNPEQKPETEITSTQNTDSTLKSVSFEGKPESDILDNKLSKERPRIQVKRRPSSRKARREAVRKSAIDFGEDSTDNSSSIDDPPRNPGNTDLEIRKQSTDHNTHVETEEESKVQTNIENTMKTEKDVPIHTASSDRTVYTRDVKSKLVYILNDEDIFNTSPTLKPENVRSENFDSNVGVTTLGKVYNQPIIKKDSNTSLFDNENDDDIFKEKSLVKKTSLFDSDSEQELFGTSKREEKKEIKREVVKGPLFGDEDDDDDLFGIKTKSSENNPQTSRATVKETPKQAEPVFEDPLSMFDDHD